MWKSFFSLYLGGFFFPENEVLQLVNWRLKNIFSNIFFHYFFQRNMDVFYDQLNYNIPADH